MKITAFVLSALGLAGFAVGQNVQCNVTAPLTPSSPVRSNIYLPKPTTSIQCWRDGYPCGHNGGQRSQRLVADFVEPTPVIAARVPPPERFSSHPDDNLPGQTDVPTETGEYNIPPIPSSLEGTPFPRPTEEPSNWILPIPVSLGGELSSTPTEEPSNWILPIPASLGGESITKVRPHLSTSWWHWPTSVGTASPSPTDGCNRTLSGTSTPVFTPLPTTSRSFQDPFITTMPSTSSHFAIPPVPDETCTESVASGSVVPPAVTPLPSVAPPVHDGTRNFLYCDSENCVTVQESDWHCFAASIPAAGPAVPPEVTSSAGVAAPISVEPVTVTIDCNMHYCISGMATVYTITPTPYTYPLISTTSGFAVPPDPTPAAVALEAGEPYTYTIDCDRHYCTGMQTVYTYTPEPYTYPVIPATSGFAVPPEPTSAVEAREAIVPIDWWRGPGLPVVPDAPAYSKKDERIHGPIQRHSSFASHSALATNEPCYRHDCPPIHQSANFTATTMHTETKPVVTATPTATPTTTIL